MEKNKYNETLRRVNASPSYGEKERILLSAIYETLLQIADRLGVIDEAND